MRQVERKMSYLTRTQLTLQLITMGMGMSVIQITQQLVQLLSLSLAQLLTPMKL